MLRIGHSTSSGVRAYKHGSEQLKEVTSNVLNGVAVKRARLENEDADLSKKGDEENAGLKCVVKETLPTMNFGGATNFT